MSAQMDHYNLLSLVVAAANILAYSDPMTKTKTSMRCVVFQQADLVQ